MKQPADPKLWHVAKSLCGSRNTRRRNAAFAKQTVTQMIREQYDKLLKARQ